MDELEKLKQENQLLINTNSAIRMFAKSIVHCRDCAHWAESLTEEELEEARNNHFADCVCGLWDSDGFSPWDYCSKGSWRKKAEGDGDDGDK